MLLFSFLFLPRFPNKTNANFIIGRASINFLSETGYGFHVSEYSKNFKTTKIKGGSYISINVKTLLFIKRRLLRGSYSSIKIREIEYGYCPFWIVFE